MWTVFEKCSGKEIFYIKKKVVLLFRCQTFLNDIRTSFFCGTPYNVVQIRNAMLCYARLDQVRLCLNAEFLSDKISLFFQKNTKNL